MALRFSNPNTPAVISMANNSFIPIAPSSEDIDASAILKAIEDNPNLILSEQAGFCYSPLICVGKDIQFEGGPVADLILVSPYGFTIVVSAKPLRSECTTASITKDAEDMAKVLCTVSCSTLDDISIDYTFAKNSKGCDLIGAMGDAGYLVYEDEPLLANMLNSNLFHSRFMYLLIVKDTDLQEDFSLVDENFTVGFLCVKTYNAPNPFAVASLRLCESD